MQAVICPVCNGKGEVKDEASTTNDSKECYGCDGKGWVEVHESVTVYPSYPTYPWYKSTYDPWYKSNW